MTGYIRLILAIVVLLSHVGVTIKGLNPGVIAVVIFYMLAGGVVSHLWQDIVPGGKGKLSRFYKDRVLRIYPLYLYIATLTLIFIVVTGYGAPQFSPTAVISNILVIPLNYYMLLDSAILTDPSWWLIPQSWSLGAELQAYILLPFMLLYKRLKIAVFIVSFMVYTLANLGVINTDYFGYRLIPGVMFIFILGGMIRQTQVTQKGWEWLIVLFIAVIAQYGLLAYNNAFTHPYTQETLIGLIIGTPLLLLAGNVQFKLPLNNMAGSLSYGAFLSHFLVIWALDYSQLVAKDSMFYHLVVVVVAVLIAYSGIQFIELKVVKARRLNGLK